MTAFIPSAISTDAASGLAVNKAYVDSRDSNYLPLSGGTVNGSLRTRQIYGNGEDYWKYVGIGESADERNKSGGYVAFSCTKNAPDTISIYDKVEICPGGYGLDNRLIAQVKNSNGKLKFQILTKTQETTASDAVYKNLVRSVNGSNADEDGNVTLSSETWTFGLADGSTVTKSVLVK